MAEAERRPEKGGAGENDMGVNVQVLLRCRPLSEREIIDRMPQVISCNDALREVTLFSSTGGKQSSRSFRFDRVFGPDSTQEKLFKQAIVPIVEEVLDGFNCTIFAYGQTGTGKTYTMEGGPRQSADGRKLSPEAGVIPRSIKQIFDTIEANQTDSTVKVSFLELYNEELTDLLAVETDDKEKRLRLLEDRSGVVAQGLEEVIVKSAVEIYQVLDRGTAKRRTAETQLNKRSSRSHSVFTITIHMREATPEGEDVIKIGKLNLVDLAGSENISRSGAKDARAREAGSINQSLLTLGRVITALVEHSGHVPYRDSKLTRLLRDSLGGRTKTCIIATIGPTVFCQEETIGTLDYAHRAKNIRNRPEVNQKISKVTMIKELATEIEKLKIDLMASREKNGVYIPTERYEQGELERVTLREQVKAMRAMAEAEEVSHQAELVTQKAVADREVDALQEALTAKESELAEAQDNLTDAHVKIQERNFLAESHCRAEAALAAHAEGISSELHMCAGELGALFDRVDVAAKLQGADREVMGAVRDEVNSRLQRLGATVSDALAGQADHFTGIRTKLDRFAAQKERDLAALQGQLAAIHSSVSALHSAVSGQLADGLATVTGALEGMQAATASHAAGAAAAEDAAQAVVAAAVGALAAAVDAQAAQLRSLAERQAGESRGVLQAVQAMESAVAAGCSNVQRSATSVRGGVAARAAAADASLVDLSAQWGAESEVQQRALLEQVAAMVARFSADRSTALAAALSGVRTQLADGSALLGRDVDVLAAGAAAVVQQAEASGVEVRARLSQSRSDGSAGMDAAVAALQGCSSDAGALAQHVGRHGVERGAALEVLVKAMSGHVSKGVAASSLVADGTVAELQVQTSVLAAAHSALHEAASAQHAADTAAVKDLTTCAAAAGVALTAFGRLHEQSVEELGSSVGQHTAQQLAVLPTPAASDRRCVQLPAPDAADELRCPPEEVIIAQYQRERAHVLRRGGDPRDHFRQVSPPTARANAHSATPLGLSASFAATGEENVPGSPAAGNGGGGGASGFLPSGRNGGVSRSAEELPKSGVKAGGGVRSRIPGAPAASLLSRANGLADRTNM